MLNKDKIRLMSGLAIYEKHGGNEDLKTAENFRYDYIMSQMFSAFVRYTLCFGIGLVLYLLFRSNDFFLSVNTDGFIVTIKNFGLIYFAGLMVYLIITLIVYTIRHKRAADNTEVYADALKKLERRYLSGRKTRQ